MKHTNKMNTIGIETCHVEILSKQMYDMLTDMVNTSVLYCTLIKMHGFQPTCGLILVATVVV